jgi:ABC-type bacteriocin/lantibiotic exporter with double-glycine peptidase domain
MMPSLVRTPLFLQMEATECGAASLAMVLAAHGRWITLEEARERCGTSRDGVDADGLMTAAESYGLAAIALKREPADLRELPMPQILHWCFNHFVVLERASKDTFTILDPAEGRRTLDAEEFGACFTGVTMAFEPDDGFEKGGRMPSVAMALIREALSSKDALIVAFVTGILGVVPGLALAGATSALMTHVLGARQSNWLVPLLAILVGITIAQAGTSLLSAWTVATWKIKIGAVSALRGFMHALTLPMAYYAQRSAGEIVSRIRIGSDLGSTIAGPLANLLPNIFLVLGYLIVLSFYDPIIMVAAIVTCCFNFVALSLITRRLSDRTREHQMAEGRASAVATSGMANLGTYSLMGRESLLLNRWAAAEDAAIATEQRLGMLRCFAGLAPILAGLILTSVVLVVCAVRAIEGSLSLGDLVATQMLASLLNKPIAALASGFCAIQESAGALMRLSDLESHKSAAAFDDRKRDVAPEGGEGRLVLSGIGFEHAPGRPILSGVDLALERGRLVAVIGPSGAGKSTLARLMGGLIDPSAGTVTLDGMPLADWPQAQLRRKLVYVGQAPASFSGSLAENIHLWDTTVDGTAVANAVHRVGLGEAVMRRPGGLETKVVSGETGLSGGELQRLSLARALARNPSVLILDETTSALDPSSEETMMAMLRASGATVIIVTHRAGTACRCDEAILVGDGGIKARGEPALFFGEATSQRASIRAPSHIHDRDTALAVGAA